MQQCPEFLTFALVARAGRKFPSPSSPLLASNFVLHLLHLPFFWPPPPLFSPNLITNGVTALNNPAAPKKRKKGYQGTFALPSSSIFSFFEGGSPPLHPSRQ